MAEWWAVKTVGWKAVLMAEKTGLMKAALLAGQKAATMAEKKAAQKVA